MLRGRTVNIAITPQGNKDIDPSESYAPVQIDLRNGRLSDAGNWNKRFGYKEHIDLGVKEPIDLLIPEEGGYAVTKSGSVYSLSPTVTYLGKVDGSYRARWVNTDGKIFIAKGDKPKYIDGSSLVDVDSTNAVWMDVMDNFTILVTEDPQWYWSAPGSTTLFPDNNFTNTDSDGERIKHFQVYGRDLYFFKESKIEVWGNTGALDQFARRFVIEKGVLSRDSVVQTNNTFYFLGNDGDFYSMQGGAPQVISDAYRRRIDEIKNREECYGIDFRKENVIRWFFPTQGICLTYDYYKNNWSEDNAWSNNDWQFLPINSYMELDNECLIGDSRPTGKIYKWSRDIESDNGDPIRVYRKLRFPMNGRGNNSRLNRIQFRAKTITDSVISNYFSWRYRIDNGMWSPWNLVEMGGPRHPSFYRDFYNFGSGREVEIEITESDAVNFLLTNLNVTVRDLGR